MKLFRIAGVAVAAAALAACGGGATEENAAATDNIALETDKLDLAKLLLKMKEDLKRVEGKDDAEAAQVLKNLVPDLIKVSKCPDYVVNKGHYFGTSFFKEEQPLGDEEKRALIEFLKTL